VRTLAVRRAVGRRRRPGRGGDAGEDRRDGGDRRVRRLQPAVL